MYNLIILLPELQLNLIKVRLVEMTRTLFFHKFSATLKKRKEKKRSNKNQTRRKETKAGKRSGEKENQRKWKIS